MNVYCGTCTRIQIGAYPAHAEVGLYRCPQSLSFYPLKVARECKDHVMADDATIESRRQLIKGRK